MRFRRPLNRRSSVVVQANEQRIRAGTLQQQQIATIEWVQGTVMGFAVGLEVLTWILVAHLIGGIEYGWPIHLVCILAWSSNADLDFDEFFRRRLWLLMTVNVAFTVSIFVLALTFTGLLPCVENNEMRLVLSILAWLPAMYHSTAGLLRTVAGTASSRFAIPNVTTTSNHLIVAIMHSWLVNNISMVYFCDIDVSTQSPKIGVWAAITLGAYLIVASDSDAHVSPTRTFFKMIHLMTFSVGVSFIADGIAPSDVSTEGVPPAYLIVAGCLSVLTVVLIRLYPDRIYGIFTAVVRARVKDAAALALCKSYQGGYWTPLSGSTQDYLSRAKRRFSSVAAIDDRISKADQLGESADYFVVCSGIQDGERDARAVLRELVHHAEAFRKARGRLPTYWIWNVCTNSMSDCELMPVYAAVCDRALIIMSPTLLEIPMGLVQLYTAFSVHCELERVEVAVTRDFSAIFSCGLDRMIEGLTTPRVRALMLPGDFAPDEDRADAEWWTEWELASRGDNLTEAKMLVRIVGSYSSVHAFTADLRERLSTVVRLCRSRWIKSSNRQSAGPADFSDILVSLADTGVIARESVEDHPLEIPRRDVELGISLGEGQFGEVWQATMKHRVHLSGEDPKCPPTHSVATEFEVAVKILIDCDSELNRDAFLREAAINWSFRHPNVVEMFGVVTEGYPMLLVLELCTVGQLKAYLEREDSDRSTAHLFSIMHGVACGMAHLTQHRFVHRDLAARNVLLSRLYVPKVADFGMGRNLMEAGEYQAANQCALLPIRWTDPDVVTTVRFSEYTDVWSYGVTCIEIWTEGCTPYRDWTMAHLLEQLRSGYRLRCPRRCPQEVYDAIIAPCWFPVNPAPPTILPLRPTFDELVLRMNGLESSFGARVVADEVSIGPRVTDVATTDRSHAYEYQEHAAAAAEPMYGMMESHRRATSAIAAGGAAAMYPAGVPPRQSRSDDRAGQAESDSPDPEGARHYHNPDVTAVLNNRAGAASTPEYGFFVTNVIPEEAGTPHSVLAPQGEGRTSPTSSSASPEEDQVHSESRDHRVAESRLRGDAHLEAEHQIVDAAGQHRLGDSQPRVSTV